MSRLSIEKNQNDIDKTCFQQLIKCFEIKSDSSRSLCGNEPQGLAEVVRDELLKFPASAVKRIEDQIADNAYVAAEILLNEPLNMKPVYSKGKVTSNPVEIIVDELYKRNAEKAANFSALVIEIFVCCKLNQKQLESGIYDISLNSDSVEINGQSPDPLCNAYKIKPFISVVVKFLENNTSQINDIKNFEVGRLSKFKIEIEGNSDDGNIKLII